MLLPQIRRLNSIAKEVETKSVSKSLDSESDLEDIVTSENQLAQAESDPLNKLTRVDDSGSSEEKSIAQNENSGPHPRNSGTKGTYPVMCLIQQLMETRKLLT